MRRLIAACTLLWLLLASTAHADTPVLPARAYLLMDATTGRVLHHFDGYTSLPMASTTKIMTALLALERGNPDDVVTASLRAYLTGEATMYLELGEQQRLMDLLYALMLISANDAGVAIAEHIAGTEERFAQWMTEKAREIGATGTSFVNSHGLHHPDHYASAYDLALIARYAMQNPQFRELVAVEEVEIPGYGAGPPRQLVNRNQLLGYYEGNNGVKNGFTDEAGLTNVASARRGNTELIAVVLGAENRIWTSSMALLDFGFDRYETIEPLANAKPEVWRDARRTVFARPSQLYVTVPKEAKDLTYQFDWRVGESVVGGDVVGTVRAFYLGDEVGQAPLEATYVSRSEPSAEAFSSPDWSFQSPRVSEPVRELGWFGSWMAGTALVLGACLLTGGLNPLKRRLRRLAM